MIREPQCIQSYAALAAIAIQSNQNDQHGGQSIPNFDYGLAKGVAKSFQKIYKKQLTEAVEDLADLEDEEVQITQMLNELKQTKELFPRLKQEEEVLIVRYSRSFANDIILRKKRQHTLLRRSESVPRNTRSATLSSDGRICTYLNTMHSRAGAQTPFSSINYGTDTSPEGRMIIRNVLLATDAGLGNGETCIFPIHIFKVKEGVNYNEGDPNYDLFRLSCKVSAKSCSRILYFLIRHLIFSITNQGIRRRKLLPWAAVLV